ncbi:MAG: hypothetical protein AB7E84_20185 [Xanthobacteraceae bacterium]
MNRAVDNFDDVGPIIGVGPLRPKRAKKRPKKKLPCEAEITNALAEVLGPVESVFRRDICNTLGLEIQAWVKDEKVRNILKKAMEGAIEEADHDIEARCNIAEADARRILLKAAS